MGFFKKVFSNPVTGFLAGGVPGALLGQKNKENRSIDSQMVNPGSPMTYLDPNDMGQYPSNGSPYAQVRQQLNARDAMAADQAAQSGALGDLSQQRDALAQRGGLSGGASERLSLGAMGNQANARQLGAMQLGQNNMAAGLDDMSFYRNNYQKIRQGNQQMQNQVYAGNQMANATLNANRPKGLLGVGFMGL